MECEKKDSQGESIQEKKNKEKKEDKEMRGKEERDKIRIISMRK